VVQLTGKLTSMKLREKQSIAEYLGEFREIKEDLEAAGQTVSDLQLAVHALRGLPSGYETLMEILESGDVELSLDTIQPKLMQREQTLKLQSENRGVLVDEAARVGSDKGSGEIYKGPKERRWGDLGFRSSASERRTCYACGQVGHIKANCRFQNAECHSCGKTGHTKAVCRARQGENAAFVRVANAVAFTAWQGSCVEWPDVWIVDSGSTRHLTPNRRQFTEYRKLKKPQRIEGISGEMLEVIGIGQVELQCQTRDGAKVVLLRDVLHAPKARANLFALRAATDAGAEIVIKERTAQFFMEGRLCVEAIQGNGLWQVVSKRGGKVATAGKKVYEDFPVEKMILGELVVEKTPEVVEIDLEDKDEEVKAADEDREVKAVAPSEERAVPRERIVQTEELDSGIEIATVREPRVDKRAQTRAAEDVEVLEEVNLIEDTGGTDPIMTARRVPRSEQKAPNRYGGSEENAWITPAKKKTGKIQKG
jgi:hypothetical protein